jgi:hypothetical protein
MNGIDEFIELSLGLFALVTRVNRVADVPGADARPQGRRFCSAGERPAGYDGRHPTLVAPPAE